MCDGLAEGEAMLCDGRSKHGLAAPGHGTLNFGFGASIPATGLGLMFANLCVKEYDSLMHPKPVRNQSLTVSTTARPCRLAVIIDVDSRDAVQDFFEVNSFCFNLWGGRFNAIILSHNGELCDSWKKLTLDLDPDIIVAVNRLGATSAKWIRRKCAPAVFYDGVPDNWRHSSELRIHRAFPRLVGIRSIPNSIARRASSVFRPEFHYIHGRLGKGIEGQFLGTNFGLLYSDLFTKDSFNGTEVVNHEVSKVDARASCEMLMRDGLSRRYTPDRLSACFARPFADHGPSHQGRFTIVVGDSIEDLALYRAIRMFEHSDSARSAAWFPKALLDEEWFLPTVLPWIARCSDWGGQSNQCQVVSQSIVNDEVARIAGSLSKAAKGRLVVGVLETPGTQLDLLSNQSFFLPSHLDSAYWPSHGARFTRIHQCSFHNGTALLELRLPEFLEDSESSNELMLDVEIPFLQGQNSKLINIQQDNEVWRLPKRYGTAFAFLPGCKRARIGRLGLPSREIALNSDTIPVRIPSVADLLSASVLSNQATKNRVDSSKPIRFTDFRVSNEGSVLASLISLFGSPFACGHSLEHPFWRRAFRALALGMNETREVSEASVKRALALLCENGPEFDPANLHKSDEVVGFVADHMRALGRDSRAYSNSQFQQLWGQLRKSSGQSEWPWSEPTWINNDFQGDLERFVSAGVLRMGVEFRCSKCRSIQWRHIDDLEARNACVGCGAQNELAPEPVWKYKLNTLAAESFRRKGVIAAVQAIYDAERNAQSYMIAILPSLDVFEQDAKQPFSDLDLVYFSNREFVIGEVKASPTAYSALDVLRLAEIAEELLPDRVVIAAPEGGDWPEKVRDTFDRVSEKQSEFYVTWELRELHW